MKIVVLGGGTFSRVACHLSLAAPAFGSTAKFISNYINSLNVPSLEVVLKLTKMADSDSGIVTNEDVSDYVDSLLLDRKVCAIFMNAALCDFSMVNPDADERLSSSKCYDAKLIGDNFKVISNIKKVRPDIILVGFKTTYNKSKLEQVSCAVDSMIKNNLDFVLANDVGNYSNILITAGVEVEVGERHSLLVDLSERVVKKVEEAQCYQYV